MEARARGPELADFFAPEVDDVPPVWPLPLALGDRVHKSESGMKSSLMHVDEVLFCLGISAGGKGSSPFFSARLKTVPIKNPTLYPAVLPCSLKCVPFPKELKAR